MATPASVEASHVAEHVYPEWLKPNAAPVRDPGNKTLLEITRRNLHQMEPEIPHYATATDLHALKFEVFGYINRFSMYATARFSIGRYLMLRVLLLRPELSTSDAMDHIVRTVGIRDFIDNDYQIDQQRDWMRLTLNLVSLETVKQTISRNTMFRYPGGNFNDLKDYIAEREIWEYDHRMGRSMMQVASAFLEDFVPSGWTLDLSTIVGSYLTNNVSAQTPVFPRPLVFSPLARTHIKRPLDQLTEEENEEEENESDRNAKRSKKQ